MNTMTAQYTTAATAQPSVGATIAQPLVEASWLASHTQAFSNTTPHTCGSAPKSDLSDREVLASEANSESEEGREVPRPPHSHTPQRGETKPDPPSPLMAPTEHQTKKHIRCHAGRMISASPKRSIVTTTDPNKSPKTGNHTELEDADLLDYDKDDALSTVQELGVEEDLEDSEIIDISAENQAREVAAAQVAPMTLPPPLGELPEARHPSPTEATNELPHEEVSDPMEEVEGAPHPPNAQQEANPGIVRVDNSYALLVFFYNADVPLEQRYPIIEGDLLKEVNFQASQLDGDFPQFASGHIRAQRGRIAILMENTALADKFAENVPELAVDTTDKQGEEVVAMLTVAVKVVDLAQHYSLADPAPVYPPPGGGRTGRAAKIRPQEG